MKTLRPGGFQRQAHGERPVCGRSDGRRQRHRRRRAVASGQHNHSKRHGNATRRGWQSYRITRVPRSVDGVRGDHRGLRPRAAERVLDASAGRLLAHARHARPLAFGRTPNCPSRGSPRRWSGGSVPSPGQGATSWRCRPLWQSGLAGSLDVDGRNWPVAGVPGEERWLTWRSGLYAR